MNINEELNKELKTKLFKTLAITSIVANVIGFLINILLYGLSGPIVIVGICCAVMIGFALLGAIRRFPFLLSEVPRRRSLPPQELRPSVRRVPAGSALPEGLRP